MNLFRRLARRILGKEYVSPESHAAALSRVKELESNPPVTYALHKDIYRTKVVDKLENCIVNGSTTAEQTAYLLGIQRALRVIEKELVIG